MPTPFILSIPNEATEELKHRIARTRLPDRAPGDAWAYGASVEYVCGLLAYGDERE